MLGLFKKKEKDESIAAKKHWYADRYQTAAIQRNFLIILTLASLAATIISVLTVIKVSSSKSIEPFVIEIEDKTGITNVIRPLQKEKFAYDETLRRYFINKYIQAIESYEYGNYRHQYYTVARLLSTTGVYNNFRNIISPNNPKSPIMLGSGASRIVKIKSISELELAKNASGFSYQVRFTTQDIGKNASAERHFVAIMVFNFFDLSLTTEERAVNPLGFQVTSYRKNAEIL